MQTVTFGIDGQGCLTVQHRELLFGPFAVQQKLKKHYKSTIIKKVKKNQNVGKNITNVCQ